MFSEDCVLEDVLALTEDWNIPVIQVDLNDNIVTMRCKDFDEVYNVLSDMEVPKIYSCWRVNDGGDIWYKLRLEM